MFPSGAKEPNGFRSLPSVPDRIVKDLVKHCIGSAITSAVIRCISRAVVFGASSPNTMCRNVMIENAIANEIA